MRRLLAIAVTLIVAVSTLAPAIAEARPNFVDLRPWQTAVRNQGAQRACIVFAATARSKPPTGVPAMAGSISARRSSTISAR